MICINSSTKYLFYCRRKEKLRKGKKLTGKSGKDSDKKLKKSSARRKSGNQKSKPKEVGKSERDKFGFYHTQQADKGKENLAEKHI